MRRDTRPGSNASASCFPPLIGDIYSGLGETTASLMHQTPSWKNPQTFEQSPWQVGLILTVLRASLKLSSQAGASKRPVHATFE